MKYLEELLPGNCFFFDNSCFLITCDFKKEKKLCYNLLNGIPRWLENNTVIQETQIYTLDNNNNIIPIKPTEKQNDY
jgi:hypothetical protein